MANIAEHLETWVALTMVALLTVFSDKIIGRIRRALNRADLRSKYFEELAADLSSFVFYADLFHLRHVRGEAHFEDVPSIGEEVNVAYVTLKKKEYVYRSWVRRYWTQSELVNFLGVFEAVEHVYEVLIDFNESGDESAKIEALGNRLAVVRGRVESWLSA